MPAAWSETRRRHHFHKPPAPTTRLPISLRQIAAHRPGPKPHPTNGQPTAAAQWRVYSKPRAASAPARQQLSADDSAAGYGHVPADQRPAFDSAMTPAHKAWTNPG